MTRRKQAESISQFVNLANSLKFRRYRLAVVCGEISSGKSKIAQAASEQLQARYIDLATDLLLQITTPNFAPTLGAYGPDNLVNWILSEIEKADTGSLVIDQIEPLLATFGRAQAVRFFRMVSQIEPSKPVIVVTYLKKQVEEAAFPIKRFLNL